MKQCRKMPNWRKPQGRMVFKVIGLSTLAIFMNGLLFRQTITDQLLIDKTVLKDCKKRHTNLSMAWIDYQKEYGFVPHSWINECIELFGIADNVRNFLEKSMEQWKLSLASNGEDLGEVDVKRRIFHGDSLSPLLFVLSMVPLSLILRRVNTSYV